VTRSEQAVRYLDTVDTGQRLLAVAVSPPTGRPVAPRTEPGFPITDKQRASSTRPSTREGEPEQMSTQSDPGDGSAPGAWLLSTQEAIDALVTGNHPESSQGSLTMDGGLLQLLRQGDVIACRTAASPSAEPRNPQSDLPYRRPRKRHYRTAAAT
jgi:hypothetical protein